MKETMLTCCRIRIAAWCLRFPSAQSAPWWALQMSHIQEIHPVCRSVLRNRTTCWNACDAFSGDVSASDIIATFSGVRALHDDGSEQSAQRVSRDYELELQKTDSGAPVLTVYGGKITTYRRLAEAALQLLLPELGVQA